jgi:2-aminoadipate transaminase
VIAPPDVIRRLVQAKQGTDLHTATFNQIVAHEMSRGGFIDRHIHTIREVYGERRDIMLASMDRHFPPEVDWTHPQGGLFLWGMLPEYLNSKDVLQDAVKQEVAFVPGEPFHPCGGGHNTMRINFSNASPDNIQEGIMRLGKVISDRIGKKIAA